ncbi:MAG: PIN domain-containing protein [Thermomicrobiales bacterium]|nr:PIN domain-containing protein [Thermomicrobiales bacterium]
MIAFVDTNIFIRLLTGDDPVKERQCLALFRRARNGTITLVTTSTIIAEVTFVLTSRATYQFSRAEVALSLQALLALQSLQLDQKSEVMAALDLWERSTLDFPDCLAAEITRRMALDGIYSYDRGFDRLQGIRRLEP